jgi:cyclophilin family peptidyl-prolyl cis-trans isomerase
VQIAAAIAAAAAAVIVTNRFFITTADTPWLNGKHGETTAVADCLAVCVPCTVARLCIAAVICLSNVLCAFCAEIVLKC